MVSVVIRRAAAAVVAGVVCAGLLSAQPASANPTANPVAQPGEAGDAAVVVEAVTGTADVLDVAPGESG